MTIRSCWQLCILVTILAWMPGIPASASSYCEPPEAARDRVDILDSRVSGGCEPDQDCWGERIAAARALADRYPDNVIVQRAYQDQVRRDFRPGREERSEALATHYAQRYEQSQDDPVAIYLHSRMVSAEERPALAERAVELDPDFPWPYLALAAELRRDKSRVAEVEEMITKFQELCPERFQDSLGMSSALGRKEFWMERAPALRSAVEAAGPALQGAYLNLLWRLEFKISPLDGHDTVRERIRKDLERFAEQAADQDKAYWQTLEAGYQLLGDQEGIERSIQAISRLDPCGRTAVQTRKDSWFKSRDLDPKMYRVDQMSAELRGELLAVTDEWLALCPDDFLSAMSRFSAVSIEAENGELSREEVHREVDRLLTVWESNTDQVRMSRSPDYLAAELLLEHGDDAGRALGLLDQELATVSERQSQRSLESAPAPLRGRIALGQTVQLLRIHELRTEALLELGRTDDARAGLESIDTLLPTLEEQTLAEQQPELVPTHRATSFELRSRLAALEARPADAFAFLRRAHRLEPNEERDESLVELWTALGGSEAGWQALADATTAPEAGDASQDDEAQAERSAAGRRAPNRWKSSEESLGEFALTDLDGKTWRPEDLRGKTVLVNLWATWCAPCRVELPYIKKLRDTVADRDDLQVLTLNVDRDLGLVAPFVQKEELDLPVLLAADYVEGRQGALSIPQNWIIDGEGVIRFRESGFSAEHAEEWVESAAQKMSELAR